MEGPITDEFYSVENLKVSITTEDVEPNVFDDASGNSNYGFMYNDFKPKFDNKTLEPKKTKNTGISNRSKINLVRRKEKKLFARKGNPSILIDDYEKNVREFINAGGKGIHHTNTSKTIAQLKRLGF